MSELRKQYERETGKMSELWRDGEWCPATSDYVAWLERRAACAEAEHGDDAMNLARRIMERFVGSSDPSELALYEHAANVLTSYEAAKGKGDV